ALESVVFHVLRSTQLWNWQSSTFTSASGAATDLTPIDQGGGLWTYTTDYFQINTGTVTWERNRSYAVHEIITDAAGNVTDLTQPPFTFDLTAPTATITLPIVAASTTGVTSISAISGNAND